MLKIAILMKRDNEREKIKSIQTAAKY